MAKYKSLVYLLLVSAVDVVVSSIDSPNNSLTVLSKKLFCAKESFSETVNADSVLFCVAIDTSSISSVLFVMRGRAIFSYSLS